MPILFALQFAAHLLHTYSRNAHRWVDVRIVFVCVVIQVLAETISQTRRDFKTMFKHVIANRNISLDPCLKMTRNVRAAARQKGVMEWYETTKKNKKEWAKLRSHWIKLMGIALLARTDALCRRRVSS